jgi:hypothetical protein
MLRSACNHRLFAAHQNAAHGPFDLPETIRLPGQAPDPATDFKFKFSRFSSLAAFSFSAGAGE